MRRFGSARRSAVATVVALVASAAGVAIIPVAPSGAVSAGATVRQLAGAIPPPYRDLRGAVRVGDDLFVVDGYAISRIDLVTSKWSVFAGLQTVSGSVDGYGGRARFGTAIGLATDGDYIYVADSTNVTIRRVHLGNAQVTTIAGLAGSIGSSDGPGSAARFRSPTGVAVSPDELHLYITDTNNCTVRKLVLATNVVSTVAGTPGMCGTTDGVGAAARFGNVGGITADAGGVLWLTDSLKVRKLVPGTAAVTTVATSPRTGGSAHVLGGITAKDGLLYVVDVVWYRDDDGEESPVGYVDKVDPTTGAVTDLPVTSFYQAFFQITSDAGGLWVSGGVYRTIVRVSTATGAATPAGGVAASGLVDGTGAAARFSGPNGITGDGTHLFVTDAGTGSVRKVTIATGAVTTVAMGLVAPAGLAGDGTSLFVADDDSVKRVNIATGQVTTLVTLSPTIFQASDVVLIAGKLYVSFGCALYRVDIPTATATLFAGSTTECTHQNGTGTAARFSSAGGMATDGAALYVADNAHVRKVVIATAQVTDVVAHVGIRGVAYRSGHLYLGSLVGIYKYELATNTTSPLTPGSGAALTYSLSFVANTNLNFPTRVAVDSGGHRVFFTNTHGVGMVTDAKVPPVLAVGDVTITEGDGGTGLAVFTVRLSAPQLEEVHAGYATFDGTATAASGDFVAQSGMVSFPPGATEARVKVTLNGDAAVEGAETMLVRLFAPYGAALARAVGQGTILNDDPGSGARIAIGDVSIAEGEDGHALAVFPVRLSAAQPAPVSVSFATASGTAAAPGDYTARTGVLSFPTGVTSATIFVVVKGDYDDEADETFSLAISGSSGPTITRAVGTGRILDDD